MNHSPLKFAVLGNPVKHSLSPKIHQLFAKQNNIALDYQAIEIANLDFENQVNHFFDQGGIGLNITIPFKLRAYIMTKQLDYFAKIAGSVNTLKKSDHQLCGFNTDGVGLIADFNHHGIDLKNKNILIIGAGGATRGILAPIAQQKPAKIMLTNRSLNNASDLVAEFADYDQFENINLQYCSFNQVNSNYDLIINATSLSLVNDVPNINCAIYEDSICYDLVYKLDGLTAFTKIANRYGAKLSLDGLGMLVEQAAISFKIWHNCSVNTAGVIQTIKNNNQ